MIVRCTTLKQVKCIIIAERLENIITMQEVYGFFESYTSICIYVSGNNSKLLTYSYCRMLGEETTSYSDWYKFSEIKIEIAYDKISNSLR